MTAYLGRFHFHVMTHSKEHIARRTASRRTHEWFTDPLISKKISDGLHKRFNSLSHAEQERIREKARIAGKTRMRERGHCKQCSEQLVGQQKVFCSRACRNKAHPASQNHKKNGVWRNCLTCGKSFYRNKTQLEKSECLYCSPSCFAKTRIGEKNSHWKNGATSASEAFYHLEEHLRWSIAVRRRDKYTCQSCKITSVKLHAHHIKTIAAHPELAFDISNGITLCIKCHNDIHRSTRGRKKSGYNSFVHKPEI